MSNLIEVLTALGNELTIPKENPGNEAYWQGIADGAEQGPELSMGMSYPDDGTQWCYDVGTWVGAAVWASKLKESCNET